MSSAQAAVLDAGSLGHGWGPVNTRRGWLPRFSGKLPSTTFLTRPRYA